MRLIHIVAMDRNRAIGSEGKIPWNMPDDLKWFKTATNGKHCIVGRKTYESLPKSVREDPNRKFHVVSKSGVRLEQMLNILQNVQDSVMVIGGSEIYSQTINIADELWVTHIDTEVTNADAYYPKILGFADADTFILNDVNGLNAEVVQYLRKFKHKPKN